MISKLYMIFYHDMFPLCVIATVKNDVEIFSPAAMQHDSAMIQL